MAATASWYHVHRLPDEPMIGFFGDLWCSEAYAFEEMTKAWKCNTTRFFVITRNVPMKPSDLRFELPESGNRAYVFFQIATTQLSTPLNF
jgi:hypothetical protein